MPEPDNIRAYLETAGEQIRWERARRVVISELRQHLEDQRDAFAAEGREEAERLAVEEMGDPVTVGAELDRIHRPKPQWGLLALTAVFALTVSSFLSNSYVALLAPLLGFYTSQVLHSLLIPRLSAFRLDSVFFYQPIAGSASFSFLWSAVYLLTLTALCARLFLWRLRKEAGE